MNLLEKTRKLIVGMLPRLNGSDLSRNIHLKLQNLVLVDRILIIGFSRYIVKSLAMESAPGTVETIALMLSRYSKDKKILDFGSGMHGGEYIKKLGFKVYNCDIVDYGGENFKLIDPNENMIPYGDNEFDITVLSEVIEHVESPFALIKEIARVTRECIIISTPNIVSRESKRIFLKSNYFKWFTPKDFGYHLTPIAFWQIENFCLRNGYKLVEMKGNHEIFTGNENRRLALAETLIFRIEL